MSLATQSLLLLPTDADRTGHHEKADQPRSEEAQDSTHTQPPTYPTPETYDDAIFGEFYDMETSQQKPTDAVEAPPLPQKNSLRASRLLDNLGLKLGGSLEPQANGQATPHDVYLSSEEDASSSADDFSDYDYDSGSEGLLSPARSSREDVARVVSVVFYGKPSIIDLSVPRRPSTPFSYKSSAASQSSARSLSQRPPSSADSLASSQRQAARRSTMLLSDVLTRKQRPAFLKIDPYANGSTYSLELPKQESRDREESQTKAPRTPRTPTALLKGVSRTFSLVRKRSRPLLNNVAATLSRDNLSALSPASPSRPEEEMTNTITPTSSTTTTSEPRSPQLPVTYSEIMRAAKKNAKTASVASPTSQQVSPVTPTSPPANSGRKSFLGGLAARRRSIKMVNGRIL